MATSAPGKKGADARATGPALMPCLMFQQGSIMLPGPDGPRPARRSSGKPYDLFDIGDFLASRYRRVVVVDLDGVERGRPQLDWLQELSRTADTWVDAGVETSDQVIDVLVTGARRAILSTGDLRQAKDVERAWALTTNLAFEIEVHDGQVVSRDGSWRGQDPVEVARQLRAVGLTEIILSPRPDDVDWECVRRLSQGGPTWVGGSFEEKDSDKLSRTGAKGGVFHIDRLLAEWDAAQEPT